MRPLDRLPSIKLKLGLLILVAVVLTAVLSVAGWRLGWPLWARPVVAAVIALALVQILAKGMTRPLRDMERAATAMANGDPTVRVHTTSTDEVGRLAEAFNDMADELAEVERQRRELLANVSHELRTPIAALGATLENLLDGVAEPTPAVLGAMHEQTERLGRLVRDLLELSRLESGATSLRVTEVDLDALADTVVAEARLVHPGVHLSVERAEAPTLVPGDRQRLHQVMANLVDNAARHGGGSAVVVRLGAGTGRSGFAVVDGGSGIPATERERIFERFHRTDPGRRADGDGSGLGLSIARWIVELHQGRITVADVPGGGCQMLVELPSGAASGNPVGTSS